jgi:hypothetical protein
LQVEKVNHEKEQKVGIVKTMMLEKYLQKQSLIKALKANIGRSGKSDGGWNCTNIEKEIQNVGDDQEKSWKERH